MRLCYDASLPICRHTNLLRCSLLDISSNKSVITLTSLHSSIWDCILLLRPVFPSCEIVIIITTGHSVMWDCYDVHFRSFRHTRLLWCSFLVMSSLEIVIMFTSGNFVMWGCYDVHFRSFRHSRLLWCSLPVMSSLEIVMMFTSGNFVMWDFYDVHFRSLRRESSLNFPQSLRCKIHRKLQHTSCAVYTVG